MTDYIQASFADYDVSLDLDFSQNPRELALPRNSTFIGIIAEFASSNTAHEPDFKS